MSRSKNDELRDDRVEQEEHRQQVRDEVFEATGEADDLGSQDDRRAQGLPSADR